MAQKRDGKKPLDLKNKKIDAIIPSRGGSKGVYRKSTVLLGPKPLIEYAIEAATGARLIRNVYLSTDEKDLLRKYGKEKRMRPIDRPAILAGDTVSIKKVILHALKKMGNDRPDLLVVLFPTAPLRTSRHIDSALRFAIELPSFDSVVSVSRIKVSPYGALAVGDDNKVEPILKDSHKYYTRQAQPPAYTLNGAIFIINCRRIDRLNDLLMSEESYAFKMEEAESVDIDTPYDLVVAQAMMAFRNEKSDPCSRGGFNVQRLYIHDDPKTGIRRNVFDAATYERHFRRYKFFLPHIKPSDSVLDIACGSGYGSEILASAAKFVHGVDSDEETIEYARRHHRLSNIKFDAVPAESFTTKKRYDKVISVETIEHLERPDRFLGRVKRWLKRGGEIWLTCPLSKDVKGNVESPFHISEITMDRLSNLMNRHFKNVDFIELSDEEFFSTDTLKNRVTYIVARGTNT